MTRIDRAIFTSVRSMSGQGYRIVAASPGITLGERKAIAKSSPSHGSMTDESDDAIGWAFYELVSGRYCVARSHHHGQEQTARGGKCVLTHSFVVDPDALGAFGGNPFSLLRYVEARNGLDTCYDKSGHLEPLEVAGVGDLARIAIERVFTILKFDGAGFLLDRAMQDECIIVTGRLDHGPDIVEGLLLSMPAAMRGACEFTIGLKFALSRRRRVMLIGPDPTRASRLARGRKVTLVSDVEKQAAAGEPSQWSSMVADCLRTNRLVDLANLTNAPFDEAALSALDGIAQLQVRLNHVDSSSTETLLDALGSDATAGGSPIEASLVEDFNRAARGILLNRLRHAEPATLKRHWPAILAAAETDPVMADCRNALRERIPDLDAATVCVSAGTRACDDRVDKSTTP